MSERRPGGIVINWKGPLLAAGIFAAAFAILLLMAYQNESKTSDMGSSFREDPYGSSLLFDSFARAGYQIKRGQDEDSLSDQDASRTTAFFIGGFSRNDWTRKDGKIQVGTKFRRRVEDFLARGGRAVLVEPNWKMQSESQGWEVAQKWGATAGKDTSPWISPDLSALPADSEKIYFAPDAPWLQTDAQWTVLYSRVVQSPSQPDPSPRVYMAMRHAGNGELIAASQESFLLNETIKTQPNPVLLDFLAGGRPVLWVDETLHGRFQDEGVLWLVRRYRLQAALLLFWATLLVLLWSMGGDLVRRPQRNLTTQVVRHGEVAGVAARRLLQRSIARGSVLAECWEQFRRGRPQDAEAISADPLWSPRLRSALAQSPLEGYKELGQLVAERRMAARGLARPDRNVLDRSKLR